MIEQAKLTPKIAAQVKRAKRMIAKVEAAEKAGVPMTDENLMKLGYVKTPSAVIGGKKYEGVWELPIPAHICKILAAEDVKKFEKWAADQAKKSKK